MESFWPIGRDKRREEDRWEIVALIEMVCVFIDFVMAFDRIGQSKQIIRMEEQRNTSRSSCYHRVDCVSALFGNILNQFDLMLIKNILYNEVSTLRVFLITIHSSNKHKDPLYEVYQLTARSLHGNANHANFSKPFYVQKCSNSRARNRPVLGQRLVNVETSPEVKDRFSGHT